MKFTALIVATAAVMAFATPSFAQSVNVQLGAGTHYSDGMNAYAQGRMDRHHDRRRVVIHRDRGHHYGWNRGHGHKVIVVKKRYHR
jgi:hypothetical protein